MKLFLRFSEYIEGKNLSVEDTVLQIVAENIMPIMCTNMTFELQVKLSKMHN